MQCYMEPLGQHCIGFCPVQCCLKSIKRTLNKIFSYEMLSGAPWGFDLCNVVPRVLRQHDIEQEFFFFLHCCLEPQEQHYIGFLLVQCYLEPLVQNYAGFLSAQYCPKSISCTGKTFHRKTICSVVFEASDNIAQEKILFNVVLILLGQALHR